MFRNQRGFTLIELLVVISVIGILAGLLLTNFVGVRGRAADVRIKNDLNQLKKALRLYYNDYQLYPASSGGSIMGCGAAGTAACSGGGTFSAGSGGGILYMKQLPADFVYYSDGDDQFILVGVLENASDEDLAASLDRCDPAGKSFYTGTPAADEYFVCED